MPKPSERDVLAEIMLNTCTKVDWFRNNVGIADYNTYKVRYGVGGKGGSDLIGIRRSDGRFVACEVKGPRGKPSKEQLQFLQRVNRAGGIGFIARGSADVIEELKKHTP